MPMPFLAGYIKLNRDTCHAILDCFMDVWFMLSTHIVIKSNKKKQKDNNNPNNC